ncbi:arginine--tRNA ligase [Candidatus Woesearchaeota archaeon]|nr:MAG: arginine--tRNA ligase [Candidatus Woesearchaeota archaeon]
MKHGSIIGKYKRTVARHLSQETGIPEEKALSLFEVPPDRKLGDIAFPCFTLAREMRKPPHQIAEEIALLFDSVKEVEAVESNGPYVNFFFNKAMIAEELFKEIKSKKEEYGQLPKKGKKFMVEYFHANTHKGVHIGHIRNISLGESLCRILEKAGIKVVRVNYQGDIGPHVAKAVWGVLNLHKGEEPKEKRGVWLGKVYAEVNKLLKEKPELEEEIREVTRKIYDNDPEYRKVWEKTRQWCLDDFEEIYRDFGVRYDRFYFESEVEKSAREIARKLLRMGIAKESDGALIVDLEEHGLGVYVLLRSDGMPLYHTKDLALAELKAKEYPDIDMSVHVVGKEQELYFKQIFKTFELYGNPLAGKSYHMIYELVMLPEGKMSSREGTLVLYDDLKEKLLEFAEREVRKRHEDWSDDEVKKTAKSIAFAALKFSMLNRDNTKTLIFDWEKAMDFEGETGPYLQYTVTRIKSILRKSREEKAPADLSVLSEPEERGLILHLARFPETVEESASHYKPLLIAKYLVELAQMFNEFYHKHPVLKAEEEVRRARLALLDSIRQVMENGLYLLGIDVLEKM